MIPSDGDDTPGDNPGDKLGSGKGLDQPGLGPEVTPPGTKLRTPPTVVIKPGKTTSNIKINTIPKETKIETTKAASKGYRNTNASLHEDAKSLETKYVTPKAAADASLGADATTGKVGENAKADALPQTGEKQDATGIMGLLAVILGFFGLADRRKKKR